MVNILLYNALIGCIEKVEKSWCIFSKRRKKSQLGGGRKQGESYIIVVAIAVVVGVVVTLRCWLTVQTWTSKNTV